MESGQKQGSDELSRVDPRTRLFGHCADQSGPGRKNREITGRTGQFLRSLILFDHVTVHTLAFREFPAFVKDLGLDATIAILNSGAVSLFPDFAGFTGTILRSGETKQTNRHSFGRVNALRQHGTISKYFAELRQYVELSASEFSCLTDAIATVLTPEPIGYGKESEEATRSDLRAGGQQLKLAVNAILRREYHLAIKPADFDFRIHDEGDHSFVHETNLAKLCRMSDLEVDRIVENAIPALATIKLRMEEMQMHSSLTEFDEEDLEFLDSSFSYFVGLTNPGEQQKQFARVTKLLDLPQVPSLGFDVGRFIELRTSPECLEFRSWLAGTSKWSDAEIIDQVKSFRRTFSRFYNAPTGKALRIMISAGLGIIPPLRVGLELTLAASALDWFVVEQFLQPSGAITFIASGYPSVFDR